RELEEERRRRAAVVGVGDGAPRPVAGIGDEHHGTEDEAIARRAQVGPRDDQPDTDGDPPERGEGWSHRLREPPGGAVHGVAGPPLRPGATAGTRLTALDERPRDGGNVGGPTRWPLGPISG